MEITTAADKTVKTTSAEGEREKQTKIKTIKHNVTCIISDRIARPALCIQLRRRTRAHTNTRTLTRNQAESPHISSHSHHSAEKSLVSQTLLFLQRPVATLKVSAVSKPPGCLLASLPPLTHSLSYLLSHFPSPLFSLFFCSLFLLPCSLICLFFPLVQCLHNAHQLFRGSLLVSPAYPIRAGLGTNGLLLYLLPAPTHSGGGRRIDRGSRGDS